MARTARAAVKEIGEAHRAAGPEARAVLHAHPRLGDDAEDALGADEQPVGARPGAGAGQAPRLHRAGGRHDAQAFDEIVDMRVEGREVAARARRDPAAEGRVLEALREVPQRHAVRPSCASSAGPSMPPWMRAAREARSNSSTWSIARRSSVTAGPPARRRGRRRRPPSCPRRTGSAPPRRRRPSP